MRGKLRIMHADGRDTVVDINHRRLTLIELKLAVGGHFEIIPRFTRDDGLNRCVVLCDDEAERKGKRVNARATNLWYRVCGITSRDALYGDVVFLTGDNEFMESI